jgi:hypothetical protein
MDLFRWLLSNHEAFYRLLLLHIVCLGGIVLLFLVILPLYFEIAVAMSFMIVLMRQWYVVVKLYENEKS